MSRPVWRGGEELARWRKARRISQLTLARALGVTELTVRSWERQGTRPMPRAQAQLEALLQGAALPTVPLEAPVVEPGELVAWRRRHGWSRKRLAAQLGVSEGSVHAWEHGGRPARSLAVRLRRLLDGPPTSLEPAPSWTHVDPEALVRWQTASGVTFVELGAALDVDTAALRAWFHGLAIPPVAVQRQLRRLIDGRPQEARRRLQRPPRRSEWTEVTAHDVAELRACHGLSLRALGARLGVSGVTVLRWERGRAPSPRMQARIARLLRDLRAQPLTSTAPNGREPTRAAIGGARGPRAARRSDGRSVACPPGWDDRQRRAALEATGQIVGAWLRARGEALDVGALVAVVESVRGVLEGVARTARVGDQDAPG